MLVFRDDAGREKVRGAVLQAGLEAAIRRNEMLSALLRAGEIESALSDAGDHRFRPVTDALARAWLRNDRPKLHQASHYLQRIELPAELHIVAPEGFSFYGLHPADYVLSPAESPCAVIGIRSIGTTLSAVAAAALECERITVRPSGHPYDRRLHFSQRELAWVKRHAEGSTRFVVVDEGPGLSGTSFLAVGDALSAAGVSTDRVRFMGSRHVIPERLIGSNAAARWRFPYSATSLTVRSPIGAHHLPDWRTWAFHDVTRWPAAWMQMSAAKAISSDGKWLFKFEGLGRYGEQARARSEAVHAAGFGPEVTSHDNGYAGYRLVRGQVPELNAGAVKRLAEYITWRATAFVRDVGSAADLERMARFNHQQICGSELPATFGLPIGRPALVDGRMMPYEWRVDATGKLLKMDAAAHGDNHFFPGPTDIAWDVAGAIVEWAMGAAESDAFLAEYRRTSGDDVSPRLPGYLTAYRAYQAGYAQMAAAAMAGSDEEPRLLRDVERYRAGLKRAAEMHAA